MMRYENTKTIGTGGYGNVYQALDTWTGQFVAIKYLHRFDDNSLRMFEREIRELQRSSQNPHIVNIMDYDLFTSTPYYVMELCEGGSLRGRIGKADFNEVISVLRAMLRALKPMHKSGGFHRDIKPDNILLALNGNQVTHKLSDFGLARIPHPGFSMTQTPGGTEPYKAPEVKFKLAYSTKADIYSLGITMFELLSGTAERQFLVFQNCPAKLTNLLRWMTESNAALRPNVNQIETELDKIVKERAESSFNLLSTFSYGELTAGSLGVAVLIGLLFSDND